MFCAGPESVAAKTVASVPSGMYYWGNSGKSYVPDLRIWDDPSAL